MLCSEPFRDTDRVCIPFAQPQLAPSLFDQSTTPDSTPVSVSLEVFIQGDQRASGFSNMLMIQHNCTRAFDQGREDGKEHHLDIGRAGSLRSLFDCRIESVGKDAMCGREPVESPQWQDGKRVNVLLSLELGNPIIGRRFGDDVPSDRFQFVDQISTTSRHPTSLIWPGTGIHRQHVHRLLAVLKLSLFGPRIDTRITALAKAVQIAQFVCDRGPRAGFRVHVAPRHDGISMLVEIARGGDQSAGISSPPVRFQYAL